jgi:putative YhdH/YhfP family quinone oxidoreductase
MKQHFWAYEVNKAEDTFQAGLKQITLSDLPEGDVTIAVQYSSVNYKDGLASIPDGKIVSSYPFIPGIDLAGEVVTSHDSRFAVGDVVVCTGYGLGVSHYGGYAEYARVPSEWVFPLPQGLSAFEAMGIGTAGFTAAQSVHSLLSHGVTPDQGPVLVTGATGGVGSMAVSILAKLGFEVVASTGKLEATDQLKALGATAVISREDVSQVKRGVLSKEQWAAVVDPVGGAATGEIVKSIKYGGAIALSGLTGGGKFETSVYPYILRGVSLLGIDSVYCPAPLRNKIWCKLGKEWKPESALEQLISTTSLHELPNALAMILKGQMLGRYVVKCSSME